MSRTMIKKEDLPELMTRREVAGVLRVSVSALSRWAAQGIGPRCLWLGTHSPRYRRDDIIQFVEEA